MSKRGLRSFLRRTGTPSQGDKVAVEEQLFSPVRRPEPFSPAREPEPAPIATEVAAPFVTPEPPPALAAPPVVEARPVPVGPPVALISLDTPYLFSATEKRDWLYDVSGLGHPEARKRWTVAPRASFTVYLPEGCPTPLSVTLVAHGLTTEKMPSVTAAVRVCGVGAGLFRCALSDPEGPKHQRFDIPDGAVGTSRPVTVDLVIDDPRSPAELGLNDDKRSLGLALISLSIAPR